MSKAKQIHETAFVTAMFRAMHEELSEDIYAKLWSQNNVTDWVEAHLNEISSEESYAHCLRNRYFLDTIKELNHNENIEVLINFGSGFSMYPFLLPENMVHIEIDKPEVVNYKSIKIEGWQKNSILPKRNISFVGVDFTKDYLQELLHKISLLKKDKPCFILIEGVLFFLNKTDTDRLFQFFDKIQDKGDYIGSVSFQHCIRETKAFRRLLHFLNNELTLTMRCEYQTIADEFYQTQVGYQLIDHQNYFSLSKTYQHPIKLEKDRILNENFYLMKKM